MSLPFSDQQCFFVAMLAFVVVGFQRGWRRELVTLVFVMLAAFLINPTNSKNFGNFFARVPATIGFLLTGQSQQAPGPQSSNFFGLWWSLLLFTLIVALGYYVGQRAFPAKPANPQERFLGVVPAIISGAFILAYLGNFVTNGQVLISMQAPNPGNFVPVIFVIAVVAVVIALVVAARAKKPAPKK